MGNMACLILTVKANKRWVEVGDGKERVINPCTIYIHFFVYKTELEMRGGIEENSKIFFLISQ